MCFFCLCLYRLALDTASIQLPQYCQSANFNSTLPYRYDRTVVIVPNTNIGTVILLQNLFRSTIFIIWIGTAFGFTILRKLFQHLTNSPIVSVTSLFFDSLGLLIGTASGRPVFNRPERLLKLWLSIFALLSGLLFSGYLFQQLASASVTAGINSLADLQKTKLPLTVYKPGAESVQRTLGYI